MRINIRKYLSKIYKKEYSKDFYDYHSIRKEIEEAGGEIRFSEDTHEYMFRTYKKGYGLHSFKDFPSEFRTTLSGKKILEIWHKNGEYHREGDLPASIFYSNDGETPYLVTWERNGEFHRDSPSGDLPAYISYYLESDKIQLEEWFFFGQQGRKTEDLPSSIRYYENGNKQQEIWYDGGVRHRYGEPAFIEYSELGDIIGESYYINGTQVSKQDAT
jgi:hypothetical protein